MHLTDQVASLDLCKRLKELGVKQESYFSWAAWTDNYNHGQPGIFVSVNLIGARGEYNIFGSAFTVAELGEMLPDFVYSKKWIDAESTRWAIFTIQEPKELKEPCEIMSENTEADARARMLIYLLEQGLIGAKNIK